MITCLAPWSEKCLKSSEGIHFSMRWSIQGGFAKKVELDLTSEGRFVFAFAFNWVWGLVDGGGSGQTCEEENYEQNIRKAEMNTNYQKIVRNGLINKLFCCHCCKRSRQEKRKFKREKENLGEKRQESVVHVLDCHLEFISIATQYICARGSQRAKMTFSPTLKLRYGCELGSTTRARFWSCNLCSCI